MAPRVGDAASPRLAFFLPTLAGGGAERVMVNLAAGFADRGFHVDLVLASSDGPMRRSVPRNVRIVDFGASRTLRAFLPLVHYLRRERPLALLAALDHANLIAMVAARAPGVRTRTIISIHTTLGKYIADAKTARERAIPRLVARWHGWADAVVAVSEGAAEDFARLANVSRDRVDVIYNAVITPALLRAAAEPPAHPWFAADTRLPVVLALGRLEANKNFQVLIEAFARVRRERSARLAIFGEGPDRAELEERVRRLGLQDSVVLPGFVDNPYSCMARAAVVAVSSDWEGLPTVLIESLAVGTPVVSTDCPSGPREILQGGALGRLVPVGDVAALATAIRDALSAPRTPPPPEALFAYTPDVVLAQYQRVFGL